MRELTPMENMVFRVGAILMVVGAAIHIFSDVWSLWLFSLGALGFCLMQIRAEYLGREVTLVRLRRQQLMACVLLILTAVCMSMQTYRYGICQRNEWVVCLTIACVLELYTAWRIPQELSKAKKS